MMAYNFSLTGCFDSSNATIHISGEWEKPREAGARDVAKLKSSYFKSKSLHRKSVQENVDDNILTKRYFHRAHREKRKGLKTFFTQQYRLFSNYSASLQMDLCYSGYTRIKIIMFEIKVMFVGIGML
jgi:hypothetical protein